MKKLLLLLLIAVSVIIGLSLVGFVLWDFNPAHWSDGNRFMGIVASILVFILLNLIDEN